MAVRGSRKTVTVTPGDLVANAAGSALPDASTKSYGLFPQVATGVVYLGPAADGSALTTSNGVRWDLAKLPTLSIDLEPGETLTARTATGTVDIDVLENGR